MLVPDNLAPKELLLGKTLTDLKLVAEKLTLPGFVATPLANWL